MSVSPVNPGDVLVGRYRVEEVLGMGAMGIVVRATHLVLGHRVALKFMLAGKGPQDEQHARFLREARASVTLKSAHVARVSDVGTLENGAPYMVMEFLEGRDLDAVLQARGPLPVAEAVVYVLQACEAIAEAHAAGIIHRDIKPANLFLTTGAGGRPCIKVLDFGISKFTAEALKLTSDTAALGSPLYMAPEHMRASKNVDTRSDIWSLGVTLYELVCGKTPFHAERLHELLAKVCFGAPEPVSTYRADTPPGFAAVLMTCLENDPARRFANVAELAAALSPFAPPRVDGYAENAASALGLDVAPARATDLLPSAPRAPAEGVAGTSRAVVKPAPAAPGPRKRTLARVVAALAVVALLAGAAVLWQRATAQPQPADAASAAVVTTTASATATLPATAEPLPDAAPPASTATAVPPVITVAAPSVPPHMSPIATTKPQAKPTDEPHNRWTPAPRR
jgi:serine/threonine-protein kinase